MEKLDLHVVAWAHLKACMPSSLSISSAGFAGLMIATD